MVLSSRSCLRRFESSWPHQRPRNERSGFWSRNEPHGTEERHEKERVRHGGQETSSLVDDLGCNNRNGLNGAKRLNGWNDWNGLH